MSIDSKISEELNLILGAGNTVQICTNQSSGNPVSCTYNSANRTVTASFGSIQTDSNFVLNIGPFQNPEYAT